MPTKELLEAASLPHEEGLGALKMLEVEEVCHATSGPRSQLLWQQGARPGPARMPRLIERDRRGYLELRSVLRRCSADWIGTDALLRDARFPERQRKAARGALKALVALEHLEWRHHSQQSFVWRWIGPRGQSNLYRTTAAIVSLDDERAALEEQLRFDPEDQ